MLDVLARPWVRLPLAGLTLAWFAFEAWERPFEPSFWLAAVIGGLAVLNAFRPSPDRCA